MKRRLTPSEREARAQMLALNAFISATASERVAMAKLREQAEREKLYGGRMQFADVLTPEMERRVRDSIRIVNLAHAGAGRKKKDEVLALKVFDEVAMLNSRGVLTDDQKFAAEKLQRDFVASGLTGAKAANFALDRVDNDRQPEHLGADRLDAVDRYVRAIRVVPKLCWPVVRDVVIAEKRIDVVRLKGMSSKKLRRLKVVTLLEIGLDELVEHYGIERRHRHRHAKMNGDARPKAADFASTAEVENQSEGA